MEMLNRSHPLRMEPRKTPWPCWSRYSVSCQQICRPAAHSGLGLITLIEIIKHLQKWIIMNSPSSSSQSATGKTAAGSKMPPAFCLVCGPQMEGFYLKGEAELRGEEEGACFRASLLGDCGHISTQWHNSGGLTLGLRGPFWEVALQEEMRLPNLTSSKVFPLSTIPKLPLLLILLHSVLSCPT